MSKDKYCQECGMPVQLGEYHPFAACLMFKGCKDPSVVRANINAICKEWKRIGCTEGEHKHEQKAREVLASDIKKHNSLYNTSTFICWNVNSDDVLLDGRFSADYLEAVVWWMRNKEVKT